MNGNGEPPAIILSTEPRGHFRGHFLCKGRQYCAILRNGTTGQIQIGLSLLATRWELHYNPQVESPRLPHIQLLELKTQNLSRSWVFDLQSLPPVARVLIPNPGRIRPDRRIDLTEAAHHLGCWEFG